jgi:hypothetical protein
MSKARLIITAVILEAALAEAGLPSDLASAAEAVFQRLGWRQVASSGRFVGRLSLLGRGDPLPEGATVHGLRHFLQ